MQPVYFSTLWKSEVSWCFQGLNKETSGMNLINVVRLMYPGDIYYLYENLLRYNSFSYK